MTRAPAFHSAHPSTRPEVIVIMTALETMRNPDEQSPARLRLAAATAMSRGVLVLHVPERRPGDLMSDFVTDDNVDAFISELRALGGMAVIA